MHDSTIMTSNHGLLAIHSLWICKMENYQGVLGIFPRKRTKASVAPAIPGLPDGVTSHFLTVLEYFG